MDDHEIDIESCSALIYAVLDRALSDACSRNKSKECEPDGARKFINPKNLDFIFYCELVDLEPDWVAKMMWQIINQHDKDKRRRKRKFKQKGVLYASTPIRAALSL